MFKFVFSLEDEGFGLVFVGRKKFVFILGEFDLFSVVILVMVKFLSFCGRWGLGWEG